MSIVRLGRFCLLATVSCFSAAMAEEIPDLPTPSSHVTAAPLSVPQAFVAAQTAQTLQTIANMRARLAELVPFAPRTDAVSQTASEFAERWNAVIDSYAEAQLDSVDAMIIGLNHYNQSEINGFLTQDHLVPEESLFDDPDFMNLLNFPANFTNPPSTEAGFFGS